MMNRKLIATLNSQMNSACGLSVPLDYKPDTVLILWVGYCEDNPAFRKESQI